MSYLLMSDIHFNNWSAFSSIDEKGINTRLRETVSEVKNAIIEHNKHAYEWERSLVIAGDVFHKRGSVDTDVMNVVIDLFNEIVDDHKYNVHILTGNHDLSSKESSRLSSSVTALERPGIKVYSQIDTLVDKERGMDIVFVPWHSNVNELINVLDNLSNKDKSSIDLIIHAPVDGIISGLPDHGLSADYLSKLGFKRVFSGHYHNHKDFGNDVYSIGALTHQTFSDIGSKAGYLTVDEGEVTHRETSAPKFVDINEDNYEQAEELSRGNYVRCGITLSKDSEINELREQFESWGARGIIINQIRDRTITERGKVVTSGGISLKRSVVNYIEEKGYNSNVKKLSLDVLTNLGT